MRCARLSRSRKIEASTDPDILLAPRMLKLMGVELANCHADDEGRLAAVRRDFAGRGDADWLCSAAEKAADFVEGERREYADRH